MQHLLEAVEQACRLIGVTALDPHITTLRALLADTAPIEVAVLGQFKAGKSSFLNSIIGHDILPVGVVPVTTVITKVRHGEQIAVTVERLSGECFAIAPHEIATYVSERRNPGNREQIRWVEVVLPLPDPLQGLVLVDTPGIGSLHRDNTDETRRFLPRAGYALYLVSAERPLGEADRELIADAARHCGGVAVVMSKCDLISPAQATELTSYISGYLAQMPERPLLWRYSVVRELEQHRRVLSEQVLGPLITHHSMVIDSIRRRKAQTLATACLDYLTIALRAAEEEQAKRDRLAAAVAEELSALGMTRQELLMIMTGCINRTRSAVEALLLSHRARIEKHLVESFDAESPSWHGNLYHLTRAFTYWLREELGREIAAAVSAEHEGLSTIVSQAAAHFNRYARAFRDRLDHRLMGTLGITLPTQVFDLSDDRPIVPDIRVSRVFDTPIELLWFLFPMSLWRPFFLRRYRRQIPEEVKKNLHRAVSDITEAINRRIERFSSETLAFILSEGASLRKLLSHDMTHAEEMRSLFEQVRKALDELSNAEGPS